MNDLMREEFERKWGYSNEEQGIYFIRELNMYGSKNVSIAAQEKSSAWFYFQVGWQASRESMVVDLPKSIEAYGSQGHHASDPDEALILEDVHAALTAAGVKYK